MQQNKNPSKTRFEGEFQAYSNTCSFFRKMNMNVRLPSSSPIQTILSALESHQILPIKGSRAEKHTLQHRRWGISPRPEDESQ